LKGIPQTGDRDNAQQMFLGTKCCSADELIVLADLIFATTQGFDDRPSSEKREMQRKRTPTLMTVKSSA
jgi:hypothetical protein